MGKLVYQHNEYLVIEDEFRKGHIIINTKGEYKNHGHVKKLKTAKLVIKLMENEIVPDSDYLRGTVLRVSLNEKYKEKVRIKIGKDLQKPKYVNINKGVRK